MILTGEAIDAATALDWGLVDVVASRENLDHAVDRFLARILECGPHVIRSQKTILREWEELSLSEAVTSSIAHFGAAYTTGEPQRAMQAFLDKRRA